MKPTIVFFIALNFIACSSQKNMMDGNDARFIFRATVERVRAATLPEIADVSNCIVVKVDEIVSAPPDFADWTGKSITVAVKETGRQKPGLKQVFYTNGWLYGRSIAVVEVASMDSRDVTNEQVLDGIAKNQDNKVRERLRSSELVVSGTVIEIGETMQPKTISEHDPLWTEATLRIDAVEKGTVQGAEMKYYFVSSGDVMWDGSPKFRKGDKGIWLFRRANKETSFRISQKEDYFPIEKLAYVRSLLK